MDSLKARELIYKKMNGEASIHSTIVQEAISLLNEQREEIKSLEERLETKFAFINNGWEEERYILQSKVEHYEKSLNEIKDKTLDSSYAYEIAHDVLFKHQD